MPNYQTIKDYLVGLGFNVDATSERKFYDALKRSGVAVEKFVRPAAEGFAVVGGAFVAAAAAIAGGSVGLLGSVAKQDLAFQLLARRMYMGVDATKKMKIATDALGYNLEEIIWGPPELAERYRQLIKDQDNMFRYLGGDGGERAFRAIRDIGFQFTRMEPALKIFAMTLTQDIVKKLTGSGSMEEALIKITGWVDRFELGIPNLSKQVSTVLVPVLTGMWSVLKYISEIDYGRMWASFMSGIAVVKEFKNSVLDTPLGRLIVQEFSGKPPTDAQKMSAWDKTLGLSKDQTIGNIIAAAKARGMDPAHVLALFEQENAAFDPSLQGPAITNPQSRWFGQRAQGLGQVMPGNAAPGQNLLDPDTNIAVTLNMLQRGLQKYGGDWQKALNDYYGHGAPMPGQPTFNQYWQQYSDKYQKYQKELGGGFGAYEPMSYRTDVGGVTIHITNPGATPEQIKKAVVEGIAAHERRRAQQSFAQRQGVFA